MNLPQPNPQTRLVQVHATASNWEAQAACQRLREAGIPAQLTGEHLGPVLKTWQQNDAHHGVLVQESQAKQAFELLTEWLTGAHTADASDDAPYTNPPATAARRQRTRRRPEWDVPSEDDTHQEPRTAVLMGTWLSKLLGVAGLCVLALACWTAWSNGRLLERFAGQATAHASSEARQIELVGENLYDPEDPELLTEYAYQVEGTTYRFVQRTGPDFPLEIPLRYDPTDPGVMGPAHIVPPLWCLFLGVMVGGFLLLGSWQFRRGPQ